MTSKNKMVKSSLITLFIALLVSLVICIACPPTAEANTLGDDDIGSTDISWDPGTHELWLTGATIARDHLTEAKMNDCLNEVHITKNDVHRIVIEKFNYIEQNTIKEFPAVYWIKIWEPRSTAIRLDKDAICYNPNLTTLDLGGIEWRNGENDPYNEASIHDNPLLKWVDVRFENYDKYIHNCDRDKLDIFMPNNGLDNHEVYDQDHCLLNTYKKDGDIWDTGLHRFYKTDLDSKAVYWSY